MATDRGNIGMPADNTDHDDKTGSTEHLKTSDPSATRTETPVPYSSCESKTLSYIPGTPSKSRPVDLSPSEQGYKATHPIGSRKVTESVITYHEPIFQSVANTLFENQKNLTMGKRKHEDEKAKVDSISPDSKRKKVENLKGNLCDPNVKIKKKCTIENIIERIRTEKTLSRGSVPQPDQPVSVTSDSSNSPKTEDQIPNISHSKNDSLKESGIGKSATVKLESNRQEKADKDSGEHVCKKEVVEPENETHNAQLSFIPEPKPLEVKKEAIENSSAIHFTKIVEATVEKKGEIKREAINKKPLIGGQKSVKVTLSKEDVIKANKLQKVRKEIKKPNPHKKVRKKKGGKDGDTNNMLNEKKPKGRKKTKAEPDQDICRGQPKFKGSKTTLNEQGSSKVKKDQPGKKADTNTEDTESKKNKESNGDPKSKKKTRGRKPKSEGKPKTPLVYGRTKRLASLNASTFMNIMYEKSPKTPKLNNKRSKSESDISRTPQRTLPTSLSFTNVANKADKHGETKSEQTNSQGDQNSDSNKLEYKSVYKSPVREVLSPKGNLKPRKDSVNENKNVSPKRKISFSDEILIEDECFNEVVTEGFKIGKITKKDKTLDKIIKCTEAKFDKKKKIDVPKIQVSNKKKTKLSPTKSPEEIAERKRKANLARLKKAKELLRAKRLKAVKDSFNNDTSDIDSSEDKQPSDDEVIETTEKDGENIIKKVRAKRGELCRAARTHISVEAKTVFENTASSPKWCECCQTSYFPSQPHQGMKVWLLKQLVDKGSSSAPEPIQSSSHHFITAHAASCEVRPYSSPTHVSVLESSPYVGPLVSHGHVACSPCGCGHSGMLHTAQCQNYSLGGVGNLLSCQHYSGTYTVPYPHSSYSRCGCASCCLGSSYHHATSQSILHQPQIPISTDASILLHRPPMQMTHDSPHSVPIQLSHSDSSLSSHSLPLHLDSGMPHTHIADSCHCLPGEVTNVSLVRSNTQSDVEYIDVGKEEMEKNQTLNQPAIMKSGSKVSSTSKIAAEIMELKEVNKNSVNLKQKIKQSSDQLFKRGKISKLFKNKEQDILKPVVKRGRKPDESKKKLKLLDFKEKKHESGLEKGTKKLIEKKVVGKRTKKDIPSEVLETKAQRGELEKQESHEEPRAAHGWSWEGEGTMKKIINIFDGKEVQRKCFNAIIHEDGEIISTKDSILVCSGRKMRDIPYVAKVTNFWECPDTGEMMMTILWYYRPEHTEGGRKPEHEVNELFAAKHRDESLVACIEDRGYVLTFNEYCRYMAEVQRTKCNFPTRKKVVPDLEESPLSSRIPPMSVDPENVFLCRHVYDLKLKRVLKNPS